MKGVAWGGENASIPLWFTRHVLADEDKMCQNVLLQGDEAHACVMLCHKQTVKCSNKT